MDKFDHPGRLVMPVEPDAVASALHACSWDAPEKHKGHVTQDMAIGSVAGAVVGSPELGVVAGLGTGLYRDLHAKSLIPGCVKNLE